MGILHRDDLILGQPTGQSLRGCIELQGEVLLVQFDPVSAHHVHVFVGGDPRLHQPRVRTIGVVVVRAPVVEARIVNIEWINQARRKTSVSRATYEVGMQQAIGVPELMCDTSLPHAIHVPPTHRRHMQIEHAVRRGMPTGCEIGLAARISVLVIRDRDEKHPVVQSQIGEIGHFIDSVDPESSPGNVRPVLVYGDPVQNVKVDPQRATRRLPHEVAQGIVVAHEQVLDVALGKWPLRRVDIDVVYERDQHPFLRHCRRSLHRDNRCRVEQQDGYWQKEDPELGPSDRRAWSVHWVCTCSRDGLLQRRSPNRRADGLRRDLCRPPAANVFNTANASEASPTSM